MSNHVGSSYSCPGCCPDSGPWGSINPTSPVVVGNSFTAGTSGVIYDGCSGIATPIGWFSMEFWVDNEAIASYNPESGGSTTVQGLVPGETTLHGSWFWDNWESDGWSMCWETRGESEDQQPIDVRPTITGPNTMWWFNGATPSSYSDLTQITLSTEDTGISYSWSVVTGGSKVSLTNQNTANVQLTSTGRSLDANDVGIQVVVDGQVSDQFNITVRAPHSLNFTSTTTSSSAMFGYRTEITYTIRDQFNNLLPGRPVPVNEHFTTSIVSDFSGMDWRQTPDGGTTLSLPVFVDAIEGETSSHFPTPQAPQSPLGSTRVCHWGQDLLVGSATVGAGRRVQSDTLQKYRDHGAHENVTSPIP